MMGIEIPPQLVATPVDVAQAPPFSDDALALEFADHHAKNLRFVATWNKWFFWDCAHWQPEETLRAWDFAREVCRAAADNCGTIKAGGAPSIASAKTVAAVERMARSDRRIAATIDQWDADPWLLNTPEGVVDLRTGKARPHRAEDYITKIGRPPTPI
jgi:putative DNA primase/helicase